MKNRKQYNGYSREVPTNIEIKEITIEKILYESGPMKEVEKEKRYIIVNADTGDVFDDAQGYGYKTKQKALIAYNYKKRPKEEFEKERIKKEKIKNWWKKHKSFKKEVEAYMFDAWKCNENFTSKDLQNLMKQKNITLPPDLTHKDLLNF